jgi:hypothetical protein
MESSKTITSDKKHTLIDGGSCTQSINNPRGRSLIARYKVIHCFQV